MLGLLFLMLCLSFLMLGLLFLMLGLLFLMLDFLLYLHFVLTVLLPFLGLATVFLLVVCMTCVLSEMSGLEVPYFASLVLVYSFLSFVVILYLLEQEADFYCRPKSPPSCYLANFKDK
ncbi:hypothetical protein BD560DRAFT_409535 [Blakeslea trispora]|nr:hypothetical protein BD560DRAFT_409535 [Blakeslea trispora]